MSKASPTRKRRQAAKKTNGAKGKANGAAAPEATEEAQAQAPEQPEQQTQVQLTEDQKYLQSLFEKAQKSPKSIAPEQKVLIEMLAESEAKIVAASNNAAEIERAIYNSQVKLKNLNEAINQERGKALGLSQALLKCRDENPTSKGRAKPKGRGTRQQAQPTQH